MSQKAPLTNQQGAQLVGAVRRFNELSDRKVTSAAEDAEKAGLEKFIREEVFLHADELLGCWVAVVGEYQPLVNSLATILSRVKVTIGERNASVQQEEKKAH